MGVIMILSLYSSRLLLERLGIYDFGVYNLVGSIIAMVSMVKGLFSSTIQRFLNYEMGIGDLRRLRTIFNMSILVNVVISVVFVCIVEILGLYFFYKGLNIDSGRLFAAKIVFHLSVISSVITIMTTSYDAVIIAHEKMFFFSIISIVDSVLRLVSIILIPYLPGDRLIIYSILLLIVSIIIRIINVLYCKRHFEESKYSMVFDKSVFRSMFNFAGWQFFGNTAYTLSQNGLNLVLNIFGGATINAARAVAFQVNYAINQFISNIIVAINPHIIKTYAEGNLDSVLRMFFFTSKTLFIINYLLIIPVFFLANDILSVWLTEVPYKSDSFVRLVLLWSLVRSVHSPIDTLFKAMGKIKYYQISEGIILFLPLLISYIALGAGYTVDFLFISMIFFEIVNLFVILKILVKTIDFDIVKYFYRVLLPALICMLSCILIYYFFVDINNLSIFSKVVLAVFVDVFSFFTVFFFSFDKIERTFLINNFLRRKV